MSSKEKSAGKKDSKNAAKKSSKSPRVSRRDTRKSILPSPSPIEVMIGRVASRQGQKDSDIQGNDNQYSKTYAEFQPYYNSNQIINSQDQQNNDTFEPRGILKNVQPTTSQQNFNDPRQNKFQVDEKQMNQARSYSPYQQQMYNENRGQINDPASFKALQPKLQQQQFNDNFRSNNYYTENRSNQQDQNFRDQSQIQYQTNNQYPRTPTNLQEINRYGIDKHQNTHSYSPYHQQFQQQEYQTAQMNNPQIRIGPMPEQQEFQNNSVSLPQMRVGRVQEQINLGLLPKKEQIRKQLNQVEARIEAVKLYGQRIEANTRSQCEEIVERLRQAVGMKVSLLTHDLFDLKKDIDLIDSVIEQFQNANDMNSPQTLAIIDMIDSLVQRKFKKQIDIYPEDLPQEIQDQRNLQQQTQMLYSLIEFKNEIIWKIHNESQLQKQQLQTQFEKQSEEEYAKWSQLVDDYQGELARYQQTCCFCGIKFDYKLVNSNCNFNQADQDIQIKIKCEENPPQSYYGTSRHFFSKEIK